MKKYTDSYHRNLNKIFSELMKAIPIADIEVAKSDDKLVVTVCKRVVGYIRIEEKDDSLNYIFYKVFNLSIKDENNPRIWPFFLNFNVLEKKCNIL